MTLLNIIDAFESANEVYTLDEVASAFFDDISDIDDDTLFMLDDAIAELEEDEDEDGIELDSARPKRKAGYKPKLVIRNGKKVWINKRNPNKKVILSAKQKNALRKARLKANTGQAKLKRAKSSRIRKRFVK